MSSGFTWVSNSVTSSSVPTNNHNTSNLFQPASTTVTQTIQSLDANETKEEKSEADDVKTNTNPSLSVFAMDRNHVRNSSSLHHTYCITSDGFIPSCETTIHWNISRRAIDQSRTNKSTIKPTKRLTISPSGRTFLLYFEPEGAVSRFGNQGFGGFAANNNNTRSYTTITVQEVPRKSSQSSSFFPNPSNGTYSVVVKVFDPTPPATQFGFGTAPQTTQPANIHNASHWKARQPLATGLNPGRNSVQITQRIQLFESTVLNSKLRNDLLRLQIIIQVPPTVITSIVRKPGYISQMEYMKYNQPQRAPQVVESGTHRGVLGVTTNTSYNASYEWYLNMCQMLESQTFGDIEIVCSDGKGWRAHKDILTHFSPVFKAMLCNPMQESLENNIELKEENSVTIKYLLLFMYTGSIPNDIDLDDVGGALLKAADKFGISGLTLLLFDFIKTRITPKNVAMALILCKLYKGGEFKETVLKLNKYVLRYLAKLKNMRKVLKSKSFELLFTQHPDLVKTVLLATNSINASTNNKQGNTNTHSDDGLEDDILCFEDQDTDDDEEEED